MDFITIVKTCFSKYATFSGRASRSEYWVFYLFLSIGSICLQLLDAAVFDTELGVSGPFVLIFSVATLLPHLAVITRRFHDIGKTGWWILWFPLFMTGSVILGGVFMLVSEVLGGLILIGGIIGVFIWWIVWLATASHAGENRFGRNPLEGEVE